VCVCVCVCVCARASAHAGLTLFNETFSLTAILLAFCVISGSTSKEVRSVLGYYTTNSGNFLPNFRTTHQSHHQGSIIQKRNHCI